MKEGQLFFTRDGKDLQFNEVRNYFPNEKFCFSYIIYPSNSLESVTSAFRIGDVKITKLKDILDIPIPCKSMLKDTYDDEEEVYFAYATKLYRGKILSLNHDGRFLIEGHNGIRYLKNQTSIIPYEWWIRYERCKSAMMELSKCLLKCKIYKDVRLLIAKEVWKTRHDYLWLCNHKHSRSRSAHKKIKSYSNH